MPKVVLGYIPRKPDFMNPSIEKEEKGFEKSDKYVGQKVSDKDQTDGTTTTLGAVFLYQGAKKQKERFVQPTTIRNYFTYYCYEIYQYCGVNTPKYRYGENILSDSPIYGETTEKVGFANISTLIPLDKISVRALKHPEIRPDQRDKVAWAYGHELELKADQYIYNLKKDANLDPKKISGNLFGAHFVGYLIQNWDMGHFNGYFIERQNRENYIVIDMDKVHFSKVSEHPSLLDFMIQNRSGKSFDYLATEDQRLAVICKIDDLLKGDLEKIYYSPRALKMFFDLQPELAKNLLSLNLDKRYSGANFDIFKNEISDIIAHTPKTKQGVIELCRIIREKVAEVVKKDGRTLNIEDLNDPRYSPDLQIECIRKNGQEIIERFAAEPKILDDFRVREAKRAGVADTVVKALEIESPEAETIKEFIIEDLRGKYYEQYTDDDQLIPKLIDDISQELDIKKPTASSKMK